MSVKDLSFSEWCLENNQNIYLDNWDFETNDISPKKCKFNSSKKYYFKCPRGLHEPHLIKINNITMPQRKDCHTRTYCPQCNSFGQWCIDNNREDLLDLWDEELNGVSPFDVGAQSNVAYYFKCSRGLHESHKHVLCAITNHASHNQAKCPRCNSLAQSALDEGITDFFESYWSDKNECSPYEVTRASKKKVWMICQVCGKEYEVRADHFCNGVRHHGCSLTHGKSKLQGKVEDYLESEYPEFTVLHENHCTLNPRSPITNYPLFYDNEIKELNLIIEVHGKQHYEVTSWEVRHAKKSNCATQEYVDKRKFYDDFKEEFAINHNYHYLVIPYWTEKDESYRQLIDEKINSILA